MRARALTRAGVLPRVGAAAASTHTRASARASTAGAADAPLRTRVLPRTRHRGCAGAATSTAAAEAPLRRELSRHFFVCAVPMVGFGLMDNTIMIHAGNLIDCTLGVTFGLSTLSAAACGQICSDSAGVVFGGALDGLAKRLGLAPPRFTAAQRALPATRRVGLLGALAGVILGCSIGLLNLLVVDTRQTADLKARRFEEGGATDRHAFHVEADNAADEASTTLTIEGPDLPGLLASLSAALSAAGVHLVEASVRSGDVQGSVRDVFVVRDVHGGQVDDDALDDLARALLLAARDPLRAHHIKAQNAALQHKLMQLEGQVTTLEEQLDAACVSKRTKDSVREHKRRSTMPARWARDKGGG